MIRKMENILLNISEIGRRLWVIRWRDTFFVPKKIATQTVCIIKSAQIVNYDCPTKRPTDYDGPTDLCLHNLIIKL